MLCLTLVAHTASVWPLLDAPRSRYTSCSREHTAEHTQPDAEVRVAICHRAQPLAEEPLRDCARGKRAPACGGCNGGDARYHHRPVATLAAIRHHYQPNRRHPRPRLKTWTRAGTVSCLAPAACAAPLGHRLIAALDRPCGAGCHHRTHEGARTGQGDGGTVGCSRGGGADDAGGARGRQSGVGGASPSLDERPC